MAGCRNCWCLDAALAAIETNMGGAWNETVVTLITEFGRTPVSSMELKAPTTAPPRWRCLLGVLSREAG